MTTASMDPSLLEFREITTDALTDAILSAFDCQGVSEASGVYVSTPITSGEAILHWYQQVRNGHEIRTAARHRELVMENIAQAKPLVLAARQRFKPQPVVEPTSLLNVPGFSQPDYHKLWSAFIERYASTVVFNDGWELSTGCAVEFATAAITGKMLLESDFSILHPLDGLNRIRLAALRLKSAAQPNDIHREVIRAVAEYLGV